MKNISRRSIKTGLAPGSLVFVGKEVNDFVKISMISYNKDSIQDNELIKIEDIGIQPNVSNINWLNIDGVQNPAIIKQVGDLFNLHDLTLEDILNTEQRPKIETFDNYLYIVLKMLSYNNQTNTINSEQVSIIFTGNNVITFQERSGDVFGPLRERLRTSGSRVRKSGADFLVYALMDLIIDNYFNILELMGDEIDTIEEKVFSDPNHQIIQQLFTLKRNAVMLRKSVWPLREVVSSIERMEETFFKKSTRIFIRDLYDHTIQVLDGIESLRDIVTGLVDVYLTTINNNMSSIMKVLTIISTIFIPLTFVAGVYGMNFLFMPELEWKWSYPIVLIIMTFIALGMIIFFRRKKWF